MGATGAKGCIGIGVKGLDRIVFQINQIHFFRGFKACPVTVIGELQALPIGDFVPVFGFRMYQNQRIVPFFIMPVIRNPMTIR